MSFIFVCPVIYTQVCTYVWHLSIMCLYICTCISFTYINTYMNGSVYLCLEIIYSTRYKSRTLFGKKLLCLHWILAVFVSCHYSLTILCDLLFGTHVFTFQVMNAFSPAHAGLDVTVGQTECLSPDVVFLGIFPSVENGLSFVEKCSYH